MEELVRVFRGHCSQLQSGGDVGAANVWLMQLMSDRDACMNVCLYILSTQEGYTAGFIASKLLQSVLQTLLFEEISLSSSAIQGAEIGRVVLSALSAATHGQTSQENQLCLCLATLIVAELSSSSLGTHESGGSAMVLEQVTAMASKGEPQQLNRFLRILEEIPRQCLKANLCAERTALVLSRCKVFVTLSFASSCLPSHGGGSNFRLLKSSLECLSAWCVSHVARSGDDEEGEEGEREEKGGGGSLSRWRPKASLNSWLCLADLVKTPVSGKGGSVWDLLLELINNLVLSLTSSQSSEEQMEEMASVLSQALQTVADFLVLPCVDETKLDTSSTQEAIMEQVCIGAASVRSFFVIAGVWDRLMNGLDRWKNALVAQTERDDASALIIRCANDHFLVGLVEVTSLLAEKHASVLFGSSPFYREVRRQAGAPKDGTDEQGEENALASLLVSILLAAFAAPNLAAAVGVVEILTLLPLKLPPSMQLHLMSAVAPMFTIMLQQVSLPTGSMQGAALAYESISSSRLSSTSASASTPSLFTGEEEDQMRALAEYRRECCSLLQSVPKIWPDGSNLLLHVCSFLSSDLEAMHNILALVDPSSSLPLSEEIKAKLDEKAKRSEGLLFIFGCLLETAMESVPSSLSQIGASLEASSDSRSLFHSASKARREGQGGEWACRLIQMCNEIAMRIEALQGARSLYPLLTHRCINLWHLIPDVIGFLPARAAAVDISAPIRLICSSFEAPLSRSLAVRALVSISNGLRSHLAPHASSLCSLLTSLIAQADTSNVVLYEIFFAKELFKALGQLLILLPTAEEQEAILSSVLTSLMGRLSSATAGAKMIGQEGFHFGSIVQVFTYHLSCFQSLLRGLTKTMESSEQDEDDDVIDEVADVNPSLLQVLPQLCGSVLDMLDPLCFLLVSSSLGQQGLGLSLSDRELLVSLINEVCSVCCSLVDTPCCHDSLAAIIIRLQAIFNLPGTILSSGSSSGGSGGVTSMPLITGLVSLVTALVRWGSEFQDLLGSLQGLCASCFNNAGAFLLATQSNSSGSCSGDDEMCYLSACFRLCRQTCISQPLLLSASLDASGTNTFVTVVFDVLSATISSTSLIFDSSLMRAIGSALLALTEHLPPQVLLAVQAQLVQRGAGDLLAALVHGALFGEPKVVRYFAGFFESISALLLAGSSEGGFVGGKGGGSKLRFTELLSQVCHRVGVLISHGQEPEQAAASFLLMQQVFESLVQSTCACDDSPSLALRGGGVRDGLCGVSKAIRKQRN